jgi:hypothetical protein
VVASYSQVTREKVAPRFIHRVEVDGEGKIIVVHTVLAGRKLKAVFKGR